jgi:hypothetical protein
VHTLVVTISISQKRRARIGKFGLTSKMNHNIWWARHRTIIISGHVEMSSQCIKDLSRICEVCFESIDICGGVWKGDEVQIQDFMAFA